MARSPSEAPQAGQKRAPAGTAAEQRGHPPSTPTVEAYTGISLVGGRSEMNPRRAGYRSMPLSAIQKGVIGQFAFLATALVTGRGQVEVYTPAADNEGRDAEVRRHLKRAAGVGIQVKVAFGLSKAGGRRTYLAFSFSIPKKRVRDDPRLWYFLALYDMRQLRLQDPVFLIPSAVLHKLARSGKTNRGVHFEVLANLSPTSRDQWSPYRIALRDLGKRLLEIIDEAPLTASSRRLKLPPDSVMLGRARGRSASAKRDRAA